jgi:Spy/CpxP family protein refolding chaperone
MKKIGLLAAAALLLCSAQVWSQPKDADAKQASPKQCKEFKKHDGPELKLTDEQKKQVDKLRSEVEKTMIDQHAKIAKSEIELRDLFKAETPDRAAIEKKIQAIADLRVEEKMIRINNWFAVNKLLTPEQQKVWRKFLNREDRKFGGPRDGERKEGKRGMQGMQGPKEQGGPGQELGCCQEPPPAGDSPMECEPPCDNQDAPPMDQPGDR